MKATGIVRRIDELGRIVVPKEIRRTLRINEGDPLEFFTDTDGKIMLKKYSSMNELGDFADACVESLAQHTGHLACIVDKDQVVAVSGGGSKKKDFYEKKTSIALVKQISQRKVSIATRKESTYVPILESDDPNVGTYNSQLIAPITHQSDIFGAVILLSPDKKMGEIETKLAQSTADILGKHASEGLL